MLSDLINPDNNLTDKIKLSDENIIDTGPKRKIYLSLGSNMGDRVKNLTFGISRLLSLDHCLELSEVYETTPVGGPAGQENYYNLVAVLESAVYPYDLLEIIHEIEYDAKRIRKERFGPRTLDIDILLISGVMLHSELLTIPHPRMHERAFVLAPLFDLADIRDLPMFIACHGEFADAPWRDVLRQKGLMDENLHRINIKIDPR